MKYSVVGISSGIGVSLFPFKENLLGNIESRAIFHTPKDIQWINNFGKIPLFKHINEESIKICRNPDILISSPDCGSGSVLRFSRAKSIGDHTKNKSLAMFFEAMGHFYPKIFWFENLEGLWKSFPQDKFYDILDNYRFVIHVAPVSMWGNSQIYRKRLIIIGIRCDLSKKIDKYFKLPDYRDKNKTCEELYGDLDISSLQRDFFNANVRESPEEMITIYAGKKMYNWEITQIWNNELKNSKRWTLTPGKKFTTAPGVYRNRKKDYPATARKANRQFDHRGLMLTPRQLARIQGVPDDFKIHIDIDKPNYWINKGRAAVTKTPPYEIALWFKHKLEKSHHIWQ